MKTATQAELVNYVTNTGCSFECQDPCIDRWVPFGHPNIIGRPIIRLKLTEYGLPSHLPPHNPANVPAVVIVESGKYRCLSETEIGSEVGEACIVQKWNTHWRAFCDNKGAGYRASIRRYTYRVPVSVPFPDWGGR